MAFLGLVSLRDYNKLREEFDSFKRDYLPWEKWQLETAESEKYTLPDPSIFGNQAELYRRVSALFTAVDIVSSCGALTDFSVARLVVGKEPKDIPNHEFEMLLRNPNPLDSRYEFLYATIAFFMLNRNSYWWLNRVDEFSPPEEMWVIPPHMIKPIPDERLFLKGYLYNPGNGREIFMQPHEIVHFKGFNPFSRFVGLSAAIESLMLIAQAYLGMVSWQTKLYNKSNARLPGILSFEQMITDPIWDKIKEDTAEAAANRNLLMLRGVGQNGPKWQQAAASQRDMQYFEGLDSIDKKIMDTLAPGAYTMLYENANEANSRTGRATLNELAIYPKHVMINEGVTNKILPAYPGRPLIGHFEDIRVTDRQLEITEQQEYNKTHTIAEIREEFYGDDPLGDDRDELLPEQLKSYKSEADKELELEKQKLNAQNAQAQNNQPQGQMESATNEPPKEPTMVQASNNGNGEKLDALGKYERYALRNLGKALKFQNDHLPEKLVTEIAAKFVSCKDESEVRILFKAYKTRVQGEANHDQNALLKLAESIENAVKLAQMQEIERNKNGFTWEAIKSLMDNRTQPIQPSIYLSPSFTLPAANHETHITMPEQQPPNTFVSITPALEAPAPADVKIDNPVYISQTIEPAQIPEIQAPIAITNNIAAQEAPQVYVNPTIEAPTEQPKKNKKTARLLSKTIGKEKNNGST